MIEMEVEGSIPMTMIENESEDKIEQMLQGEIANAMVKQIMKHLDNMAFIDLKINEETKSFDYEASVVLCSKQDIITNAGIVAQKLRDYDLEEEDILDILETQTQSTGGF